MRNNPGKKGSKKEGKSSKSRGMSSRTQWEKERRRYWQHQFRRVLSKSPLKSNKKKIS